MHWLLNTKVPDKISNGQRLQFLQSYDKMQLNSPSFSVAHAPVFFLFPPCGKMMQQVMAQCAEAVELMSHLRKSQNMNMRHVTLEYLIIV